MDKHADESAIRIRNRYAALYAARLRSGDSVPVPDAPYVHLFVARGHVALEGEGTLAEGDADRLTGGGGQDHLAVDGYEVLIWEMTIGRGSCRESVGCYV